MCLPMVHSSVKIERGASLERDIDKLSRRCMPGKMDCAVNARRLAHRTADPAPARPRLDQYANRASDTLLPGGQRSGALSFTQADQPAPLFAGRHLIRQVRARRSLLAAVLEKPHAIELRARNPLFHVLHVFFAL